MSTTASQPSCALRQYRIKRLLIEERRDADSKPDLKLIPDVCFRADSKEYRTVLRCEYANGKTLFQTVIEGDFEFKEVVGQSNAMHAWVNGGTVLYGILRGLYSGVAAQCTGAIDILPTVMMVDYVKQRIQELVDKASEEKSKVEPPKTEN